MKLYISGPIKGVVDAEQRFLGASCLLSDRGHEPINPFDVPALCLSPCAGEADERHYDCHMRGNIAAMMACDGVALIRGWEKSRGARLEHAIALQVGLPVRLLQDWPRP